ncbi:MAG TPA: PadR family transcriptional regulator [Longimicrobiales bacterium]|nr:PadR family transcriptional regulator [Longimicrobiales bacterium]
MPEQPLELLKGTLDVLILKTLQGGAMHGYGVSRRIRETTGEVFRVEEGALYPALRRLEKRGLVEAAWGVTDTGREARFYRLTPAGEAELSSALEGWHRYVEAMGQVLGAASET